MTKTPKQDITPHTTHHACDEIMQRDGGKAVGCCCTGHECKQDASELDEQISKIQLPIEYPNQLYLRKGKTYVNSYDPVTAILVGNTGIIIAGHNGNRYAHSFDEFDSIYVAQNESVML